MLSYLIAGVLLVGLAAAPNLSAQGFAGLGSSPSAAYAELELNKGRKGFLGPDLGCSVEKLAGTWMYKGEARYLSNLTEVFPDFPAELAGLLVPRVGIVVIDEQGNGTFLEDFSIGLRGPGQTFAADFAQFADIRVEVFPDCSAFTLFLNKETGEEIQRFYTVYGNGMREAFALEVGPASPQNPVPCLQTMTQKRIDAFD